MISLTKAYIMGYWTVFNYGGSLQVCSKHSSLRAATKAAKACEKRGGAYHRIIQVQECGR